MGASRGGDRRVLVLVGTRPEAIKLAPLIQALRRPCSPACPVVVATAQHREMLDQALSLFEIVPDIDLDLMQVDQNLADLTGRVLRAMGRVLSELEPSLLLVQGDTVTAFSAALAAFYSGVAVAHVEAGLRSRDLTQPFPEEAARRLLSVITDIHFAPTPLARRHLLSESVPAEKIVVTGNTVVDALERFATSPLDGSGTPLEGLPLDEGRILLVTSHRRESWGRELENICRALRDIVARFEDVRVLYPVHLNPNVKETVDAILSATGRVHLLPPLDYASFTRLMRRADVVLTDSGGVQEEAASLHKPLLCLRRLTERPEAFERGLAKVVGTDREAIVEETTRLLSNGKAHRAMTVEESPYGDGRAAERIVEALGRWFRGQRPLLEKEREFAPSGRGTRP